MALLVLRHLSNTASFVLCVLRRVKDHHKLQHDAPLLEKTCVRQVVLDKWCAFIYMLYEELTRLARDQARSNDLKVALSFKVA